MFPPLCLKETARRNLHKNFLRISLWKNEKTSILSATDIDVSNYNDSLETKHFLSLFAAVLTCTKLLFSLLITGTNSRLLTDYNTSVMSFLFFSFLFLHTEGSTFGFVINYTSSSLSSIAHILTFLKPYHPYSLFLLAFIHYHSTEPLNSEDLLINNSVRTSQKTLYVYPTKFSWLMFFGEKPLFVVRAI